MIRYHHEPEALGALGWHDTGRRVIGTAIDANGMLLRHYRGDDAAAFRLTLDPDTWGIFTRTPAILT
ncbi:MAG TPA: hypothetical protein VN017_05405 [Pseudoxanthomonas sp.]|nr:hypothetical protein [Pseudoxanthomonas sp.]